MAGCSPRCRIVARSSSAPPPVETCRHMRSDITPWTIRGMGLALGAAIVFGLVQLGIAAGGVLLLVFIAILLASALEPFVGWVRARVPIGEA